MTPEELRKMKDRGPYDTSLEIKFSMYDKMPYCRDILLCNKDKIGLLSGNVIKYYRCKISGIFSIAPKDSL